MPQANGVPPAIDREQVVADVSWRDDPAVQAWSRPGSATRRPLPAGTPSAVDGLRAEDVAVVLVEGRPLVVPIPRAVALASGYILLDPDPELLRAAGVVLDAMPEDELQPVAAVFELLEGADGADGADGRDEQSDGSIMSSAVDVDTDGDLAPSLWGDDLDDSDEVARPALEPVAITAEQLTDAGAIWWPEHDGVVEPPTADVEPLSAGTDSDHEDEELRIWAAPAVPTVDGEAHGGEPIARRWPEADVVPTWPEDQVPADAGVVWPPTPASPAAPPSAPTGLIGTQPAQINADDPVAPPKGSLQVPIWAEILDSDGETTGTAAPGAAVPVPTSDAALVFPFIDTDVAVPLNGPAPMESDSSAPAVRNGVEEWSALDLGTPSLPDRSGDEAFDWPEPESSWPSSTPQWDEPSEPASPVATPVGLAELPPHPADDDIDWPVFTELYDDAADVPAPAERPDTLGETTTSDPRAPVVAGADADALAHQEPDTGRVVTVGTDVHDHLLHAGRISVRGVVRVLHSPVGTIRVLDSVDLDVAGGELVVISGPSPSGASTLLDCLAGLDEIDAGEITVEGVSIGNATDAERAHQRSGFTGYIPQENELIELFTVVENVALPLLSAGWAGKEAREEALRRLEAFGLTEQHAFLPSQLSAAQRRCVLAARALAGDPSVVLADHPLAYLDDHQAAAVIDELVAVRSRGGSVIVVDRDARIVAHADRRLVLRLGRLMLESTP